MKNIFNKFFLFFILLCQVCFAQNNDGFAITRDKDGNIVFEGISVFESPKNNENIHDKVPPPSPVDDRINKGGNGSNGGGNSNSGGGGGKQISSEGTKSDQKYDRVIDSGSHGRVNSGESSGDRYENSNSSSGTLNPSRTYTEVIEKGHVAQNVIRQKITDVIGIKSTTHEKLVNLTQDYSKGKAGVLYQSSERVFKESDRQSISASMINYAKFNNEIKFIPFKQILFQNEYAYDKYKKELAEKELNKLFPGQHDRNLSELTKARGMIRDLKIADKMIKDALFNDLFVDSEQAITQLQQIMDATYVGHVESGFLKIISDMEIQSQYRLSLYVGDALEGVHKSYFGSSYVPESALKAGKLLNEAMSNLKTPGNALKAANKILQAKLELKLMDSIEDSHPEDVALIMIGAGVILSKSIAKYGVIEAATLMEEGGALKGIVGATVERNVVKTSFNDLLKKSAALEDKSIISKLISEYELLGNKSLKYNPENKGLLHYLKMQDKQVVIANTFKNNCYTLRLSEEGEVLYRYYDLEGSNIVGSFFSKNLYNDASIAYKELALPQLPKYRVEFKLPKGIPLFEGEAGPMVYNEMRLPGGANQVFLNIKDIEFSKFLSRNGVLLK